MKETINGVTYINGIPEEDFHKACKDSHNKRGMQVEDDKNYYSLNKLATKLNGGRATVKKLLKKYERKKLISLHKSSNAKIGVLYGITEEVMESLKKEYVSRGKYNTHVDILQIVENVCEYLNGKDYVPLSAIRKEFPDVSYDTLRMSLYNYSIRNNNLLRKTEKGRITYYKYVDENKEVSEEKVVSTSPNKSTKKADTNSFASLVKKFTINDEKLLTEVILKGMKNCYDPEDKGSRIAAVLDMCFIKSLIIKSTDMLTVTTLNLVAKYSAGITRLVKNYDIEDCGSWSNTIVNNWNKINKLPTSRVDKLLKKVVLDSDVFTKAHSYLKKIIELENCYSKLNVASLGNWGVSTYYRPMLLNMIGDISSEDYLNKKILTDELLGKMLKVMDVLKEWYKERYTISPNEYEEILQINVNKYRYDTYRTAYDEFNKVYEFYNLLFLNLVVEYFWYDEAFRTAYGKDGKYNGKGIEVPTQQTPQPTNTNEPNNKAFLRGKEVTLINLADYDTDNLYTISRLMLKFKAKHPLITNIVNKMIKDKIIEQLYSCNYSNNVCRVYNLTEKELKYIENAIKEYDNRKSNRLPSLATYKTEADNTHNTKGEVIYNTPEEKEVSIASLQELNKSKKKRSFFSKLKELFFGD